MYEEVNTLDLFIGQNCRRPIVASKTLEIDDTKFSEI